MPKYQEEVLKKFVSEIFYEIKNRLNAILDDPDIPPPYKEAAIQVVLDSTLSNCINMTLSRPSVLSFTEKKKTILNVVDRSFLEGYKNEK